MKRVNISKQKILSLLGKNGMMTLGKLSQDFKGNYPGVKRTLKEMLFEGSVEEVAYATELFYKKKEV